MRPRCSILTGGFDFSGCGDCTSCPPFEQTGMSNKEPSAIVLQGIRCMCGLYKFQGCPAQSTCNEVRYSYAHRAKVHPRTCCSADLFRPSLQLTNSIKRR